MIHQVVTPIKMPVQSKEVQASFPVSSGTHHRAKENVAGAAPNAPVFEERNNVIFHYIDAIIFVF